LTERSDLLGCVVNFGIESRKGSGSQFEVAPDKLGFSVTI